MLSPGLMEQTFRRIASTIDRRYGPVLVFALPMAGWLSVAEDHHLVGAVINLPNFVARHPTREVPDGLLASNRE